MGPAGLSLQDDRLDQTTVIGHFAADVSARQGVEVGTYAALHAWSVAEPELFWGQVWEYFGVAASMPYTQVLDRRTMPGARWFAGATLNYVDQIARHREMPGPAIVSVREGGERRELSWPDLLDRVAAFAEVLRASGVRRGDRVAAYLPNDQESVIAFLGAAAVGAIWACCAPDYGAEAVAERLGQLRPRVLVASVRHTFAGRPHDRGDTVEELVRRVGAGTLVTVGAEPKWCEQVQSTYGVEVISWDDAVERAALSSPALRTEQVPAEHPLWVLFSSGTTGKPKGIVHSHAGIIVTHLELFGLQMDLRPGDAFFWYTTTNWMLWNIAVGALLSGVTTITYDGSPIHPEPDRLWAIAAQEGVRVFGTSPGHLRACAGQNIHPAESYDFSALELVAVTGAPMSPDLAAWVTTAVAPHAMVVSSSGGTDVASSFVGGAPSLRVSDGQIPAAILGVAVATFDEHGHAVRDTLAELVVTQPMPSMPLYLWDDTDGARYRETYFSTFPGVWRHGDWATHNTGGGFEIHGRSDATLNRHGVRIGSADLYSVVESHPAVEEAMVVGVERPGGEYRMPIFIVPRPGMSVDDAVVQELRDRLRSEASPRHVPDEFYVVEALPHTKTGKKLEVPVKRILQGARPEQACSPGSLDRPELLEFYADLARRWEAG